MFLISSSYVWQLPSTDFDVTIIGAGFSGIAMAVKLKELGVKFRIIENDKKLGGTWWENQYPGCACDVPSHLYWWWFTSYIIIYYYHYYQTYGI